MRLSAAGESSRCVSAAANAFGSSGGATSSPSRPLVRSISKPEIMLATTGRPQLMASSSTMPKLARWQGVQKTSAEA
jgi:hypothetical protein